MLGFWLVSSKSAPQQHKDPAAREIESLDLSITMALAALNSRCVAPVASRRPGATIVAPKAAFRPLHSSFNGFQKAAPLVPQIQSPAVGLRSPVRRAPLSVNAAAAGGAAAPAKFKWGADMKNLVSWPGSTVFKAGG